jgi:hypothetical protein
VRAKDRQQRLNRVGSGRGSHLCYRHLCGRVLQPQCGLGDLRSCVECETAESEDTTGISFDAAAGRTGTTATAPTCTHNHVERHHARPKIDDAHRISSADGCVIGGGIGGGGGRTAALEILAEGGVRGLLPSVNVTRNHSMTILKHKPLASL